MSVIRKESVGTSLIFLFGVVLGYINLIFIYPFCLSVEQIGLLKLLLSISTFFASFVPLGSHVAIIKFLPSYNKSKTEGAFISVLFLFVIVGFLLFLSLFSIFYDQFKSVYANKSPEIINYTVQLIILLFNIGLYKLLIGLGASYYKVITPTFLKEIYIRIGIAVLLCAFYFGFIDFSNSINLIAILYCTASVIQLIYFFKSTNIKLANPIGLIKKTNELKTIFKYGFLVMLSNSGLIITRSVDTIMIGAMLGLKETGIYSIVYIIGQVVEIPKRALSRVSSAVVSNKWEKNKVEDIEAIYKKSSIINFMVGGLIFILIWINIPSVFQIMPKGELFAKGQLVIFIIGIGKVIDLLGGNNGEIIKTSSHYWFSFVSTFTLAIIAILLNYGLIPIYGLEGAAFATFLALVLNNLIMGLFIYSKFKIQPFSKETAYSVLFLFLLFFIGANIPHFSNPYLSICFKSLLIIVIFGLGISFLNLSPELKDLIFKPIKKFTNGKSHEK